MKLFDSCQRSAVTFLWLILESYTARSSFHKLMHNLILYFQISVSRNPVQHSFLAFKMHRNGILNTL